MNSNWSNFTFKFSWSFAQYIIFLWMESFKMNKKQRIVYEYALREGSDFNAGLVSNISFRPAMVIEMSQNGCRPVWLLTAAAPLLALSTYSASFVLNKVNLSFILLVTKMHTLYSAHPNEQICSYSYLFVEGELSPK